MIADLRASADGLAPEGSARPGPGLQVLTGGEAVAHAMRQIDPDVVPVYPITPQTPIIETFARFVAEGRAGAELINVESEHSALSAALGAALAGGRTMTATASQGLALMIEVLYIAASARAPIVMAVGNRALSGPINIHGDHSDSMLARDSGAIQLFVQDAQEAYDFMVMAPRLAEHARVRLPILICLDGFTLTHSGEPVELLADHVVRTFVGDYQLPYPLLDHRHPVTQGAFAMPDVYFEFKRQQVAAMEAVPAAWAEIAADFEALSGRRYGLLESYRLDDAERAILLLGSTAGCAKEVADELRDEGQRVGVLALRAFRPLPVAELRQALKGVRRVAVLDRALAPGALPPLTCEMACTLQGTGSRVDGYVYGLGGRDLSMKTVRQLFLDLAAPGDEHPTVRYLGLRE